MVSDYTYCFFFVLNFVLLATILVHYYKGIKFMDDNKGDKTGMKDYSVVDQGDVVILPAFGATIQEMQLLDQKGKTLVFIVIAIQFHLID